MKYCLFVVIIFPLWLYSQTDKISIISDSSFIIGIIENDTYIGQEFEGLCNTGYEKKITSGAAVVISGTERCTSVSSKLKYFYRIIYKNKIYLIEKEKVLTEEDYFSKIDSFDSFQALKFRENAIINEALLHDGQMKKILNFIKGCASKGLTIMDWSFYDSSEYTEGTGVKFTVYNPTKKNIKYLWFTVVGYNAVNDVIYDRVQKKKSITFKGVGPIKPEETGTYDFEYAWFTDLVEDVKITQIKVQFMDGSIKTILNPKQIMLAKADYNFLSE